jgi:hypothetical protein
MQEWIGYSKNMSLTDAGGHKREQEAVGFGVWGRRRFARAIST